MDKYYVSLEDWIEIRISGSQTVEYLNGIITKDLNLVSEGEIVRSAFLTPNAKVRSVYWLMIQEGEIFFYCPSEMKEALVEDLLKYKLSMDVKLEDISEETDPLYLIPSEKRIPGLSSDHFGFDFAHLSKAPEGKELSYPEFAKLLVRQGVTPTQVMEGENPYELGIDDVISLEKGCFLGQEPISRMYHRGNPRKYIYQVSYKDATDEKLILKGDKEVGEVLISVEENSSYIALAYLRRTLDNFDNLQLDNAEIQVLKRVGTYPENER